MKKSLQLLSDFVAIQSVSTDPSRYPEMLKAVEFLTKEIKSLGFEVKTYQRNNCPPLIIAINKRATTRVGPTTKLQTIGIYAHYDVQPEDPVTKWDSPPFKLTARNGKLFGRGVADDKMHIIQILTAIRRIVETQNIASLHKNNIVLIFEGEEEIGSPNFEYLINHAKDDLKDIDVFYGLDFGMETSDQPEIFFGLRGLIAFELEIITGKKDLHSGVYGNRVNNPINVLIELLAKFKNSKTGTIMVPGFYKNIIKPTEKEWEYLINKKQTEKDFISESETFRSTTVDKNYPWLSTKVYPSFDINGIVGGYNGQGIKTVISTTAQAKFSFRLIENQTPEEVEKLVKDFVKDNLPKGVKYNLKTLAKLDPFHTDINNKFIEKTDKIFKEVFGKKSLYTRSGGSIGAAATVAKTFYKPLILTGFTLADCNIHSPNENIDEKMFEKGITAIEKIITQFEI
jgi:acetylornithine deacetylase/succinyl-diaminopimelate desuccinylase-like protein